MIAAVILAAGQASRMGAPKQLLPLAGKPVIRHVAETACLSAVDECVIVTGCYSREVMATVRDLPVKIIYNPAWTKGQAGSVVAGIQAVSSAAAGVLFLLADQPLVTVEFLNHLLVNYRTRPETIVVPVYQGKRGTPVLFDLPHWRRELLSLTGDEGARKIILQHPESVWQVEWEDKNVFRDIDTEEDYQEILHL
ncbi:nucleotide-diphospho-sugar transferases [Lucifera butyrica]|uniref:Nucleotide-diphospho-sugar transferases n=1 Tax=Lucifera butyrica TaxID=1351585 RepID=A0A498RCS8_9FIRM|nr:nucleotidyltransferase family protein [Lucifera butyrica]VBB08717.1 nucleotide-diphospho-sugar transferases [Lucifera butyrica]